MKASEITMREQGEADMVKKGAMLGVLSRGEEDDTNDS